MGTFIFLLFLAACIWSAYQTRVEAKLKREFELFPSKIDNFKASQHVIGIDKKSGLALDEYQKKVCFFERNQKLISSKIFTYKDFLSSEVFQDGSAITSTVRTSQIGGAIIGGLALGGLGAIIGGLSGKTKESVTVKQIVLRLAVNDTKQPVHEIIFLNLEAKKSSATYLAADKLSRHWHGLIEVLIKRADMEDRELVTSKPISNNNSSIADELKKLVELRDSGILSNDEFQKQKNKILVS